MTTSETNVNTDVNTIFRAICVSNFTNEELNSLTEAIRYRRNTIAQEVKQELQVGAQVSFISSRTGVTHAGTVVSIKIKNAVICCSEGNFRVPCSMLKVA